MKFEKCPKCNKVDFDSDKYTACFLCNYKECSECGKRNIKADSKYTTCYNCFKN